MNSFRMVLFGLFLMAFVWLSCGDSPAKVDGGVSAGGSASSGGGTNAGGGSAAGGNGSAGGLASGGGAFVDAGVLADAGTAFGDGETCLAAADLIAASVPKVSADAGYAFRVDAPYGKVNNYSPYNGDPEPPNCSVVYSVPGNDVVYAVTLNPGQKIDLQVSLDVSRAQASVYVLDTCDPPTIRDGDKTGSCGSNEFNVSSCGAISCDPAKMTFLHPLMIEGVPTQTRQFWIVVDKGPGLDAANFHLDWKKTPQ
jgi:hypothetical protein